MIWFLSKNKFDVAAKEAWDHPQLRKEILSLVNKEIEKECDAVSFLSKSNSSSNVIDTFKSFSVEVIAGKFSNQTPLLYSAVCAAAFSSSNLKRNTQKTEDYLKPAIVNTLGTLLFLRTRNNDLMPSIISIILRRGGTNKRVFDRLNHLGLCLSYKPTLNLQSALGKDNKATVRSWFDQVWGSLGVVGEECDEIRDVSFSLGNISLTEEIVYLGVAMIGEDEPVPILPVKELVSSDSKRMEGKNTIFLAGDNVNIGVKPRHTKIGKG